MYTVLIQNQKTMELFRQFRPIFMEALNNGSIGTCQWQEAGTSIATALPELYDMTDDKEEWRAVIVRIEDEESMAVFDSQPENPYDFLINTALDSRFAESPVPLIRLTQMLGGVPAPQMRFEPVMIEEKDKAPRVIYNPSVTEEDAKNYASLCEKYRYDGKLPSEIIMVSLRDKPSGTDALVKKAWEQNMEIRISDFWKRNGYPGICRFTVFDMEQKGAVQRTADLFSAWTAVMLLATNNIDPSTLQAYKLHIVSVDFNREQMQSVMQSAVSQAQNAQSNIRTGIQRDLEHRLTEEVVIPNYRLETSVVLKLPKMSDFYAADKSFHLTTKSIISDVRTWNAMEETAEHGLNVTVTHAERALDQTADRVRTYCYYSDFDVFPITQYQREDFEVNLHHDYRSVLNSRSILPNGAVTNHAKITELSKRVKDTLLTRVSTRQAATGFTLAVILVLLSFVPAAVFFLKYGWGSWQATALSSLSCILLCAAAEGAVLLVHLLKLRKGIKNFNSFINETITHIAEGGIMFSRYIGSIASFIHGNSFLSILQRKKFLQNDENDHKRTHLTALDTFIANLQNWCKAFYLNVYFEASQESEGSVIDTNVSPDMNPVYTFESGSGYSVPVNSTGDTVESPFSFIERLHIIREELYDDAR